MMAYKVPPEERKRRYKALREHGYSADQARRLRDLRPSTWARMRPLEHFIGT